VLGALQRPAGGIRQAGVAEVDARRQLDVKVLGEIEPPRRRSSLMKWR
jgi:hypothetical protein